MRDKNTNVSWLDLLLVIAIMLATASIAAPSLIRSSKAADGASAVGSLRTTVKSAPAKPGAKLTGSKADNLLGRASKRDARFGQVSFEVLGRSDSSDTLMDIPMSPGSIGLHVDFPNRSNTNDARFIALPDVQVIEINYAETRG